MTTHADNTARPTKAERAERPKRVPISGNRDILTVNGKDENYVYRFVNDVGTRIQKFLDAGYEFAPAEGVAVGDKLVGATSDRTSSRIVKPVGGDTVAVLMRIRREWYEEDQKAKQAQVTELERTMSSEAKSQGYTGKLEISR